MNDRVPLLGGIRSCGSTPRSPERTHAVARRREPATCAHACMHACMHAFTCLQAHKHAAHIQPNTSTVREIMRSMCTRALLGRACACHLGVCACSVARMPPDTRVRCVRCLHVLLLGGWWGSTPCQCTAGRSRRRISGQFSTGSSRSGSHRYICAGRPGCVNSVPTNSRRGRRARKRKPYV